MPFLIRIPEEERRPMETMLAEFEAELPGILNGAGKGCLHWQRAGMGVSPEVRIATADCRVDMDTLGEFLSASCIVEESAKVSSQDL